MPQDNVIDIADLKIVISFVDKDYSRYTLFIPLFKFSQSILKLEDKYSRYLKLKYQSRSYPVPKMANLVTSLICCGIDRFIRLDDEFMSERGLAKSLGFRGKFPTSRTIYRFFHNFTGYNVNQLERVNLEMLKEQKEQWYPQTGSVFIDLDMCTKSVEGKKIEQATLGYNRKSPGRLCLNWTVGHIAKVALFSQLHSGKTSGRTVLKQQVSRIEKLIERLELEPRAKISDKSSGGNGNSRFVWRVDGGYFSWNNLAFLNQRRFITRLPVNLKVLRPLLTKASPRKDRAGALKWRAYAGSSEYCDLGLINFPEVIGGKGKEGTNFRVVLIHLSRKKKGKRIKVYYPICTNLFDWKARSIVKAYRGRQIVENCFRDTNQAFYSNKLPSSAFHGNQAFLYFICIAYNLFFFFQKMGSR